MIYGKTTSTYPVYRELKPMIFPRVLLLLSSRMMRPVTGPAPAAKLNIYLNRKNQMRYVFLWYSMIDLELWKGDKLLMDYMGVPSIGRVWL